MCVEREIFDDFEFGLFEEKIDFELSDVIDRNVKIHYTGERLAFCYSVIDHTTLNVTDSRQSVCEFVSNLKKEISKSELGNVASVCVYPRYVDLVSRELLGTGISVCCVAGGFPSSQTFPEVKELECIKAIENGADEIDIVLSVGELIQKNYTQVYEELKRLREVCKDKVLKVIIESGELKSIENIFAASVIAMKAGADFIKTSTGKVPVNATPEAVYIMAYAIKQYYDKTGRKVGLKVAGSISTPLAAIKYMSIVSHILGEEWLNKDLFRIGTSSLTAKLEKEYNAIKANVQEE